VTKAQVILTLTLVLLAGEARAATRIYLPSAGAADISPPFTFESAWDETSSFADRLRCVTSKINSPMTGFGPQVKVATANKDILLRQFVSDPLAAQIISGTVKGTIRASESATNDNLDQVRLKLLVVSNDGQTLRGVLLARNHYGPLGTEFNATTL